MDKKIGDFELVSYDNMNVEHVKFKNELTKDQDFKNYFGTFFAKNIDDIFASANELEVNKAFLLLDDEKIIGMIRIFSYHEAGFLNLQYAINPLYRNQKYGTRILKEISNYLFENGVKVIDLNIDKSNIGSIKCATKVGYEQYEEKYRLRR